MPKAELTLEEESPNFRERESAVKFTLKNNGPTALEVLAISPRIPEGVVLVETKETSISTAKARHIAVCNELNVLTSQVLQVTNKAVQERYRNIIKEYLKTVIDEMTVVGFWRTYVKRRVSGYLLRAQLELRRQGEALVVKIENAADAKKVYDELIEPSGIDDTVKKTFAFKIEKIATLEEEIGQKAEVESAAIATIEPDSFFTATYILRFPRNSLSPSRFAVSVEARYREQSKTEQHNGIATKSVTIAAHPLFLTFVSMFAAALGVVLKHVVPVVTSGKVDWDPRSIPIADFIASLILALIFFNAFEFTDLLKDLRQNMGWRSAMLIGATCGLASDRIFDALKALIGG